MKMRYVAACIVSAALTVLVAGPASAAACTKIQSGDLVDVNGNPITLGYDKWGYNYQAHMFNGLYENFGRPPAPVSTSDVNLRMKWSDDWLANQSCDGNFYLDRGLDAKTGNSTGTSMGWLTNHMEGDCLTTSGDSVHVTYFVKIVWVGPATSPDPWVGKRIWGEYAVIEEVGEDPTNGACLGIKGLNRDSLVHPAGFGAY